MDKGGLAKAKNYALSDADIRTILGNNISILTYPQLAELNSIDECFDDKGRCILLFLTQSANSGHWCCLLNKKDGIHFFDPYGDKPESQFENVSEEDLREYGEDQPYLTQLLKASGRPVYYNTHQFQSMKSGNAECGRHSIVRCLYAPYSLDKYKAIIDKSGMTPDEFVVGVTYDKLRK